MRSSILLLALVILAPLRIGHAQAVARYRHAADVFELLDNVSDWWPGYSDSRYRHYWTRHIGVSAADDTMLARYARLRERYFDKTGQSNENPATSEGGLFTARATSSADPVGDAFLRSETIDEALDRLRGTLQPDEVAFLRRFYAHFEPRYGPLVTQHERAIRASLAETNRALTSREFAGWIARTERFFGAPTIGTPYEALYVWWPDTLHVVANVRGRHLVLRAVVRPDEPLNVGDVVAHEIVHAIAARQPSTQKRALSDALLRDCPATAAVGRLNTIEEPIAVVLGNMLFMRAFRPERYRFARRWYGNQWVDVYAKLLFSPLVEAFESGRPIADGFVDQAVPLCTALVSLQSALPSSR
jgi:hypothetical protein